MKKKIFLQFFLFLLFLLLVLLVYNSYKSNNSPPKKTAINKETMLLKDKSENLDNEQTVKYDNLINNLSYSTVDNAGNKYSIFAMQGIIEENKPNIVIMDGVSAEIDLNNYHILYIQSKKAIFNNISFNSIFEKSVKLSYLDHFITAKMLDLNLDTKIITLKDEVVYKNKSIELNADYITFNLDTKESVISMYDKQKKIKIFQSE
jgi:hypothetical protein|tara:strand:- start:571 stop:1185 length:615 start_codon:yes stop_codon:yes gene_type:complete